MRLTKIAHHLRTLFTSREMWRALTATAVLIGVCVGSTMVLPAQTVQDLLESATPYAELLYLALFTILPALLFPVVVLVSCAGITFGFTKACILTILGIALNATLMFYLARLGVQPRLERVLSQRLPAQCYRIMNHRNQRTLAISFLILRLIPLVSFNLLNYLGGLTKMRFRTYFITTMIGTLPGTLIYINMACQASHVTSPAFIGSVILTFLLIVIPSVVAYCWSGDLHD